jgi:hypothetical protein
MIQYAEKMSQRMEQLKCEDPLLQADLILIFQKSITQLAINLGCHSWETITDFLPLGGDSDTGSKNYRSQFCMLMRGQCEKQSTIQEPHQ